VGLVLDILKQEHYFHSDAGARFKLSPPGSSGFENQETQNIDSTPDVMADDLSRLFETCLEEKKETPCYNVLTKYPLVFEYLTIVQRQDPELAQIIQELEAGDNFLPYSLYKEVLHCPSRCDGTLKVVVPAAVVSMVLEFFRNSVFGCNFGVLTTIRKARAHFIWKGMSNDVLLRYGLVAHMRLASQRRPQG
jgi:hypothetical protein